MSEDGCFIIKKVQDETISLNLRFFHEIPAARQKEAVCLETELIFKIVFQLCNGNSYLIHGVTVTHGYCKVLF